MESPQEEFVKEAFEEISVDERQRIKSDARVVEAIRSKTANVGSITLGTQVIRFRLFPNKKIRRQLALYKTRIDANEQMSPDEMDKITYETVASLCMEQPWNMWETWSVFDDESEVSAQEVLVDMMKAIRSHIEDVKSFR